MPDSRAEGVLRERWCGQPPRYLELRARESVPALGAQQGPRAELRARAIRGAAPRLLTQRPAGAEDVLEDGKVETAALGARRHVEAGLHARGPHVRPQALGGGVARLRRDPRFVRAERGLGEVDGARGGDAEPEGSQVEAQIAELGAGAVEEDEAVVGDLGEGDGQLARAVQDAALQAGAETGAVAQRRVPERRVQQVVQVLEPGGHRELGAPVDQLLQDLLLGVGIDQLAGRVPELRLDHAAEAAAQGADLRGSRASRPDTLRHGPAPEWRRAAHAAAGLRGARWAPRASGAPSPRRPRPACPGCGRDAGRAARGALPRSQGRSDARRRKCATRWPRWCPAPRPPPPATAPARGPRAPGPWRPPPPRWASGPAG